LRLRDKFVLCRRSAWNLKIRGQSLQGSLWYLILLLKISEGLLLTFGGYICRLSCRPCCLFAAAE
jgi:hypothetical protein